MSDSPVLPVCLVLMTCALMVMTVVFSVMAYDLHRTLRRVQRLLPGCERAVREAAHIVSVVHQITARAGHALEPVEALVHKTYEAASKVIGPFIEFTSHMGNGARPEPRRHSRRGR